MSKPKCIYCGTTEDLSDSDIIPDALTASRIINKCVCHVEHNSGMTKRFEYEVYKNLSFLLNYLDIKSSNSTNYPFYEADYMIAGNHYHDKKVFKEHDFVNKKILWNEKKNTAFGPYEKIAEIAKSKVGNADNVEQIDINTQVVETHIPLKYEVFFSEAMHRQVAKIAYEWYCLKNEIEDCYEDFSEIIDYILNGNNDQIVRMVTDITFLEKFSEFCHDGSHAMVGYIDCDGGISVLINMFGIALYDVKVCKHIPEFCKNNCLLQMINIDGTGNRKEECLCVGDYNDLFSDMLGGLVEDNTFFKQSNMTNGVRLMVSKKNTHYNLFFMSILDVLARGVEGIHCGDKCIVDFVIKQIQKLLDTNVIHKRGLKRFVEENIGNHEIIFNKEMIGNREIFYYYILFKLGESELQDINDKTVEQLIIKLFKTRHIDAKEIDIKKRLEEMLQCEKYADLIKEGAKKIENW